MEDKKTCINISDIPDNAKLISAKIIDKSERGFDGNPFAVKYIEYTYIEQKSRCSKCGS